MEGFKNSTRMKTFGDVAPQAYAKGGAVKPMVKAAAKAPAKAKDCAPMKKASGGDVSKMTRDQRMASMEKSSRAMTPAETRSMQAIKAAKAAAPKREPLIKPARQMTPAERRMNEMDRPTNSRGAEAYKSGGKVGGSKVPFAVKKVMRKAEGGVVAAPQAMTLAKPKRPQSSPPVSASDMVRAQQAAEMARLMGGTPPAPQGPTPQSVFGTSPGPMPTMPTDYTPPPPPLAATDYQPQIMPVKPTRPTSTGNASNMISAQQAAEMARLMGGNSPGPMPTMSQEVTPSAPMVSPEYLQAMQEMRAMQDMKAQREAAQIRMGAAPRFMR